MSIPSFRRRKLSLVCILWLSACTLSTAFTTPLKHFTPRQQRSRPTQRRLAIDPVEAFSAIDAVSNNLLNIPCLVVAASSCSSLEAILSQMILLKPAMEHTQPFWGPPDRYLSAGKSIAPSGNALADMGIEKSTEGWPEFAQMTVKNGASVIDKAAIKAESLLPGFSPVGGILPGHDPGVPAETPATFAAQVEWAAGFLNVVDKLPEAAFAYALIEFFILRPGIDMYKEDVEEDPGRAFADTLAVTGVRLSMFCIVAVVTTGVFG
jgi:hypothetical protein